jgi:hypothetical protein
VCKLPLYTAMRRTSLYTNGLAMAVAYSGKKFGKPQNLKSTCNNVFGHDHCYHKLSRNAWIYYGAFTLDVKLVFNVNLGGILGGILSGMQC